jgi:hypothetical protein
MEVLWANRKIKYCLCFVKGNVASIEISGGSEIAKGRGDMASAKG